MHTISFHTFFVWEFKIVVDSWKFSMLLLYIIWDDWPIFMISDSYEQVQQQLEYTLLKPDCHSWGISKMQSETPEERYAIKFRFKLGKMTQKRMECFRQKQDDQHEQTFSSYVRIRDAVLKNLPRVMNDREEWRERVRDIRATSAIWWWWWWSKTRSLWGMIRGLGGVRKSEHQSWLAKRLGLGLLCWGFKGVQGEIPREEDNTLQIGLVAFPPG